MSYEHNIPQDEQSPEPGKRYVTFEHRLVDVVGTPPSGETYDAIGREADETIAAYNRRCARLDAGIAALRAELARKDAALKAAERVCAGLLADGRQKCNIEVLKALSDYVSATKHAAALTEKPHAKPE